MASYDQGRTLQIGGGILFYEEKQSDGSYSDKVYFGPTEGITLSTSNDFVEHMSTEGCVSLLDKKIAKSKQAEIKIESTTINPSSLARAFQGTITEDVQTVASAVAVVTEAVKIGAVTNYGYVGATIVVVKDVTDATTYVEGVDYELVKKAGYLIPLVGGAIDDDDVLHLTVTAPEYTSAIVSAMMIDELNGRFTLVTNSNTSNDYEYTFKNVSVTQDGDFSLKGGEEFAVISYLGTIMIDAYTASGEGLSQFFDIKPLPSGTCEVVTVQ